MTSRRVMLAAWLMMVVPAITTARDQPCDRECLEGFARGYVAALTGHAPSTLKWADKAIFTENGIRLEPGEALWGTISEANPVTDLVVDTDSGNVALFLSILEGKRPALLAARLQIRHGAIAELETIVARKETSSFLAATLPAGQPAEPSRPSHTGAQMIAGVNAYLAAIAKTEAPMPPLSTRCERIENGVQTTHNPDPLPGVSPSPLRADVTSLGCEEQFRRGLLKFISRVREVRFPVVDVQRGIVNAFLIFDHDGKPLPSLPGKPLSSGLQSPYSFVVSESFQFEADGIGRIVAVITQVPYGTRGSAWPGSK